MGYKYQTHMHTSPCSKCARISMADAVKTLYEGGYAGGIITNHFYHGNTGIEREKDWADFVREYENDWLEGTKEAEKYGIDIVFSVEEGIGEALEILPYGITPEILYAHPEIRDPQSVGKEPIELWRELADKYGFLILQAHPTRKRDYIPEPKLVDIRYLDGFESYNIANIDENNEQSLELAKQYPGKIFTCGGDAHNEIRMVLGGIETKERITDTQKLISVLKSGDYEILMQ